MSDPDGSPCCCGGSSRDDAGAPHSANSDQAAAGRVAWIVGAVGTPTGEIPRVATTLGWVDRLGAWQARWAIRRMRYRVEPGLYAVGEPTSDSPVFAAEYERAFGSALP